MNLLRETEMAIEQYGYHSTDIVYIGSRETGHRCTWAEFESLANFDYDNSYGNQEVAEDLIVVFSDGSWLQRDEYDGEEWWDFVAPFVAPVESHPIRRLADTTGSRTGGCWSLASLHPDGARR